MKQNGNTCAQRLNFDPYPKKQIQNKIDFYYLPYNYEINTNKHM